MIARFRWRSPASQPSVVIYTRRGCGLCEAAERLVAREAKGALVTSVDVDSTEELAARYGVRVPVITVDDVEVAELQVSPGEVRRAVRAAVGGHRARR